MEDRPGLWSPPLKASTFAAVISGLLLLCRCIPASVWFVPFVAGVYVVFAHVATSYLANIYSYIEEQPMVNMKRVVSLGRRCQGAAVDEVVKCLEERVDAKALLATVALPTAAAALTALVHSDAYLYAAASTFYLLSLAFAVLAVARTEPICQGGACKAAGLAQVIGALVVIATHHYIFSTHHYELQDALALFDVVPSLFTYTILISTFVALSLKDKP